MSAILWTIPNSVKQEEISAGLEVACCSNSVQIGEITVDANDWNAAFGELARETMSSPELERYYSVPITRPRAQLLLQQLSLYVRHRRDCWAFVSGNCPVLAVKQKILAHEYEEMIRDAHSEHGHLDLIIRQGKAIGLTAKDILETKPLPATMATLYSWGWMTKAKSWLEGLGAMTITE